MLEMSVGADAGMLMTAPGSLLARLLAPAVLKL